MACFIAPAAEAVITTTATKIMKSKESKCVSHEAHVEYSHKIKFSTKLGWLNKLLWGGSALLAFEHLWHGEVAPYFPFLTAVEKGTTTSMLREIATTGVTMAVLVTGVWVGMLAVAHVIEKRAAKADKKIEETA